MLTVACPPSCSLQICREEGEPEGSTFSPVQPVVFQAAGCAPSGERPELPQSAQHRRGFGAPVDYWSSLSTACCIWFACARAEMPVWFKIEYLVKFATSVGMSAEVMELSAE